MGGCSGLTHPERKPPDCPSLTRVFTDGILQLDYRVNPLRTLGQDPGSRPCALGRALVRYSWPARYKGS
jgi:hypothetical protein